MKKLNLENDNVFKIDISVDQAKNIINGEITYELNLAIDNAQSEVRLENTNVAYVVIKIS